ncbi:helix-turn-helix domain-containing protein [Streptomyces polyrhachis]|uniref:Helix-turn-helix domain-containing protein n=1 Tax=Streptomyces polyrhachis TaxID=1282885 RepID=A0ABW2GHF3_9ACTN
MRSGAKEEFAALVREVKERSGLSYGALAARLHLSASTLHRYCSGESVPLEYVTAERLARLCGATSGELLELHRRWLYADALRREPSGPRAPAAAPVGPKAPASPPPPVSTYAPSWARSHGAVHGGRTVVEVVFEPRDGLPLVVRAVRIHVVGRGGPLPWNACGMSEGCVDSDVDVRWYVEVEWSRGDQVERTRIGEGELPFRTSGLMGPLPCHFSADRGWRIP